MNKNELKNHAPNSDLLQTFIVIADSGNLTLAAVKLNRTQSAISVQLRKLETELGVSLFERNPRGMSLTECGQKLMPVALRVIAEIDQVKRLFATPLKGRIRVGIPDDFDDTVLEQTLADFAKRNPGVEVVATSGCTSGFAQAIAKDKLDLAVCSGSDDVPGEVFQTEATIWAACDTVIYDRTSPIPLAVLDRNCWWQDLPTNALDASGLRYNIAFTGNSFSSLKAAIRSGLAVGVIPKSSLETGMKILTGKEGFPALPASKRAIIIHSGSSSALTSAMSDAIKGAGPIR